MKVGVLRAASISLFLLAAWTGGCGGGSTWAGDGAGPFPCGTKTCQGNQFCVEEADGLGRMFPSGCVDLDSNCAAAICAAPYEVSCAQKACSFPVNSQCSKGGNFLFCDEG
jgi:hypothetical protein